MNNHNETSDYQAQPADPERPYFSEAGLERRIAYGRKQSLAHASLLNQSQNDPFKAGELRNILRQAKLTKRQYEVIKLRSGGMTFDEIGRMWNRTKQGAQRVYQQAVKKLRKAQRFYPFAGLNEVYRQEIHRGAFR